MKKSINISYFIVAMLIVNAQDALGEKLKAAITNWPPWEIIEGTTYSGIEIDIVKAIAGRLNLEVEFIECPWSRCLSFTEAGEVDINPGLHKTEK